MWLTLIAKKWRSFKWKITYKEPCSRLSVLNQLSTTSQCMYHTYHFKQPCIHYCSVCPASGHTSIFAPFPIPPTSRVLSKELTCPD